MMQWWVKRFVMIAFLGIICSGWAETHDFKSYFEKGNDAYRKEDYKGALKWYQKILDSGYESSQIYYNLGNCYYKLSNIGKSVLNYEKARKLAPSDREIAYNLELVSYQVVDRIIMPPRFFLFEWWDALRHLFTISGWTRIAISWYIVSIFLVSGLLFLRRRRRIKKMILLMLAGALLLTGASAYLLITNIQERQNTTYGVVVVSSADVVSAPNAGSSKVFVLHSGMKVLLIEQRNEWTKISLPDGKSGWVQEKQLGII